MHRRRPRPKEPRERGSWSDLPIRIGQLDWPQWWRATIYTVIVLAAIVTILLGSGHDLSHLLRFIHWP